MDDEFAALPVRDEDKPLLLEQLRQLCSVTWEGHVLCATHRDHLINTGLAQRYGEYSFITLEGLAILIKLHLLPPSVTERHG